MAYTHILFRICPHCIPVCYFSSTITVLLRGQNFLEQSCCKKQQKSPGQETGLGNRGRLKVLNENTFVLNEHDYEWPPHLESLHLVSFRTFLNLRKVP